MLLDLSSCVLPRDVTCSSTLQPEAKQDCFTPSEELVQVVLESR